STKSSHNMNANNTVKFQMRVTSNIDIYGSTKSFDIYQDLLIGKINQTNVISNILAAHGELGIHCMIADLLDHMYEYTKIIILRESYDQFNNNEISHENQIKTFYVG